MKVPLYEQNPFSVGCDALMLSADALASGLADSANSGDPLARYWLDKLIGKKIATPTVLAELATVVRDIERIQKPRPDHKARKVHWQSQLPEPEHFPSIESAIGLTVVRIINGDLVPKLHRCADKDCCKYFVGDARARWCSNACGSKNRQLAWRKRHQQ